MEPALLVVLATPVAALLFPFALASLRRRHVPPYFPARARRPALVLPSAEETAASVERFREAARRCELVDFVWERRHLLSRRR